MIFSIITWWVKKSLWERIHVSDTSGQLTVHLLERERSVVKCSEVKCGVVKWSEVMWSEDLWWNVCIIIDLQLCNCIQILCSTLYWLLFASLCYFPITWLMFFNILLMFVFMFSILCILCSRIVLCIVSAFVLSLSYFCTSLPTTATGWKHNCSK
jgi:hypothetical protein